MAMTLSIFGLTKTEIVLAQRLMGVRLIVLRDAVDKLPCGMVQAVVVAI
jgi:hypothetical protein